MLANQFEPTDLTIQWDESPEYTGEAETDIIYEWKDGPPDELGVTWCDDAKNDIECDQHYVRFNRSFTPTGRVICHESGHAVGLLHGDPSDPVMPNDDASVGCMETPVDGLDSILGEHNVSMINDTYPQPEDVPGLSHE